MGYQREDALCEFALFFDDLGLDFFKINHVNIYARAWYNQDERQMFRSQGIELIDAPGVQSDFLHTHCKDAPRRRLFQETPAYAKMPLYQRTSLHLAQRDMRTLGTSRDIGPLIRSGQKLEFEDGTEGYAMPIIKHGARYGRTAFRDMYTKSARLTAPCQEAIDKASGLKHRQQRRRPLLAFPMQEVRARH
jgi:hypothetical protein